MLQFVDVAAGMMQVSQTPGSIEHHIASALVEVVSVWEDPLNTLSPFVCINYNIYIFIKPHEKL